MTIIIDDKSTCPECGAYYEDTGYCVNGHLPHPGVTPSEVIFEVATLRKQVEEAHEKSQETFARLQASKLFEENEQAAYNYAQLKARLQDAETYARDTLLEYVASTGERKGFGWQAKEFTVLEYDEDTALEWAKQKPGSGLLTLNKAAFKKAANANREGWLDEDLSKIVSFSTETRVQIAKDLIDVTPEND
jgi:hypothetical protein